MAPKSNKPMAIHRRIKKNTAKLDDEFRMLYGHKPIETWDLEELQRGRPRNSRGNFSGGQAVWIPPIIQTEISRRLKELTAVSIQKNVGLAIDTIVELMRESRVDVVRLQASQYVINQVMGMPTIRQEIQGEVNVQAFLAEVMRNPNGEEHRVIEGTIVDRGEDEDDDD